MVCRAQKCPRPLNAPRTFSDFFFFFKHAPRCEGNSKHRKQGCCAFAPSLSNEATACLSFLDTSLLIGFDQNSCSPTFNTSSAQKKLKKKGAPRRAPFARLRTERRHAFFVRLCACAYESASDKERGRVGGLQHLEQPHSFVSAIKSQP